jgi:O-antigen/teichoic acid export membrane protein
LLQKIRELSKNLAIYGLGDVAISVVNFLLLPLYVLYLTQDDYGVLALLGSVEVIAKILFRWGLDGSFMRLFYDCDDDRARQRLASTIFWFLLTVNGLLLLVSLLASPALARWLFGGTAHLRALQLTLVNTFVIGFTFFPFHVLRIEQRSLEFSALTLARSVSTVIVRFVLIVWFGYGVLGVVLADILVTAVLILILSRWFAPLIRPVFSRAVLREALRFGLPRVPHAGAQQVIAVGDKLILTWFRPISDVGIYAMGVSFGLTQKLFLSAFEYAWAPFYYATSKEPHAERVLSTVTTYGVAVLALMTAGLSAIAADLLDVVTRGQYTSAAGVVAWTSLGVFFQGIYLMTSIGLNITRHTQYYPVATSIAAAANVGLNLLLIPRFGIMGAAYANGAAYAIQAAIAFRLSQRFYPITYESGRLARVVVAALLGFGAGWGLPPMLPILGVVARGSMVIVVMGTALWIAGFFQPQELRALGALVGRRGAAPPPVSPPADATEFAGEIIAADFPDERVSPHSDRERVR